MSAADRPAFRDDFIPFAASVPPSPAPSSSPSPPAPSRASPPATLDQLLASLDAHASGDRRPAHSRKRKRDAGVLELATPWARGIPWHSARHAAQALHREIVAFDRYLAPTPGEHDTRRAAIQLIRQAVTSRFRDADVRSFGSQETRLYLPQGDIDLVCVSDAIATQNPRRVLYTLKTLIQTRGIADDVQVIAHARVPIIKFTTLPSLGNFKVDMSLNHTNGIAAARFVNSWLRRQPAVRPLTMCIKLLLAQRGLSEVYSGGLGSFACTLLVISFLQLHPKVQRREIDPCDNLGVLLLELLLLYGKQFNYDNVGITVRSSGGYFSKARSGWKNEGRPFLLSIEDPLDTTNDVSRSSFNILAVRQTFSGAYDVLSSALCRFNPAADADANANADPGRHLLLAPRRPQKSTFDDAGRRQPVEPSRDPRSLLGYILGVSDDAVRQRKRVRCTLGHGAH